MATNSPEIVQQIRDHFEALLTSVTTISPEKPNTAYDIELHLLRRLLELGKLLLQLCFVHHSDHSQAARRLTPKGHDLPYHSHKTRSYWSVFGKIRFERAYYYGQGQGYFALDAALNLPAKACSDLLAQWREHLAVRDAYHNVGKVLADILGQPLGFSTRALSEQIQEDGTRVQAFYKEAPPPKALPQATILVVQADGKGVPMVKDEPVEPKIRLGKGQKAAGKKEAIVTCVYTLAPWVRTPQEVVDSLFKTKPDPYTTERASGPENKRWWATLAGKDAALTFTREQVVARDTATIRDRVALTDGSSALQKQVRLKFADFTLVLDLVHAVEYLWEAANALLGETDGGRTAWVQARVLRMLSGQTQGLIDELRALAALPDLKANVPTTLAKVAGYYESNLAHMHYDQYLGAGWPVATGVIEGACRHLVKDRCELSGMRWTRPGAEALLHLRCVSENGDWETFQDFRRCRRLQDLYGRDPQSETTEADEVRSVPRLRLIDCQAA